VLALSICKLPSRRIQTTCNLYVDTCGGIRTAFFIPLYSASRDEEWRLLDRPNHCRCLTRLGVTNTQPLTHTQAEYRRAYKTSTLAKLQRALIRMNSSIFVINLLLLPCELFPTVVQPTRCRAQKIEQLSPERPHLQMQTSLNRFSVFCKRALFSGKT